MRNGKRMGTGAGLLAAALLALTLAPAMQAHAADARAVRSRVAPVYPEVARRMRVTGVVKLSVTVNADGKVTDVKPVSGNQMLSYAAQQAVRKWKFESGAGSATMQVDVNFELAQ
ncbi:MAG TPA: energy transducer TonB [Terracidiphilus sp.]|nr:energy transducer TonB [Terracidiphilus sp.]